MDLVKICRRSAGGVNTKLAGWLAGGLTIGIAASYFLFLANPSSVDTRPIRNIDPPKYNKPYEDENKGSSQANNNAGSSPNPSPQQQAANAGSSSSGQDLDQKVENTTAAPVGPFFTKYGFNLDETLKPYQKKIEDVLDKVPKTSTIRGFNLDLWQKLTDYLKHPYLINDPVAMNRVLGVFLNYQPVRENDKAFVAQQYETLVMTLLSSFGEDLFGHGQADLKFDEDGNVVIDERGLIIPKRLEGEEEQARLNANAVTIGDNISTIFGNIDRFRFASKAFVEDSLGYLVKMIPQRSGFNNQRFKVSEGSGVAAVNIGPLTKLSLLKTAIPLQGSPYKTLEDHIAALATLEEATVHLFKWADYNFNAGDNKLKIRDKNLFYEFVFRAFGIPVTRLEANLYDPAHLDQPPIDFGAFYLKATAGNVLFRIDPDEPPQEGTLARVGRLGNLSIDDLFFTLFKVKTEDARVREYLKKQAPRVTVKIPGFVDPRNLGITAFDGVSYDVRDQVTTIDMTTELLGDVAKTYVVTVMKDGNPAIAYELDKNGNPIGPPKPGASDVHILLDVNGSQGNFYDRYNKATESNNLSHRVKVLAPLIHPEAMAKYTVVATKTDANGQVVVNLNGSPGFHYAAKAVLEPTWAEHFEAFWYFVAAMRDPSKADSRKTEAADALFLRLLASVQYSQPARVDVSKK